VVAVAVTVAGLEIAAMLLEDRQAGRPMAVYDDSASGRRSLFIERIEPKAGMGGEEGKELAGQAGRARGQGIHPGQTIPQGG
jgi:hypothetical protein